MTMKKQKLAVAIGLLTAHMIGTSQAASISINFHVGDDMDAQADHELATGETAGLIATDGALWNNINVGNGGATNTTTTAIFASTTLTDDSGANAAIIAPSATSSRFVGYAASSAAAENELGLTGNNDDLYNSYLALNGPGGDGNPADAAVLNITNLSSDFTTNGYRVIIYSDSDRGPNGSGGNRTSSFTIGTTTQDVLDNQHVFDNTFILGTNYTEFVFGPGAADNFTIDVFSDDGGRGSINGIQIIAAVPEPSSTALLGLGGLALILRRRK